MKKKKHEQRVMEKKIENINDETKVKIIKKS